ncbi:PaaI family thioesterase [Neobacillus drentensis]|uniref:PaaI family thioesterase n=1 Tax=Neobacillus drentensis TaxID=220684 RepID=UPI0030015C58
MTKEDLKKQLEQRNSFDRKIGVQINQFEEGNIVLELPVTPYLLNPINTVHGGVYAVLLDTVMGITARSFTDCSLVTVNLNINYLEPTQEGEKMVAKANIIRHGTSLVTAEGEVRDSTGKLLAIATGTFKMMN